MCLIFVTYLSFCFATYLHESVPTVTPLLSHTHYRSPAQFAFHSHLSADADRDNLRATAYASLGELIGRTPRECAPIVVATLPSIVQRMRIAHQARRAQ